MSKKKTPKQQRKDFAAFAKVVTSTLRQMRAGKPIRMIVNIVDMQGQNLVIQTVAGSPHPPTPPSPGSIAARSG
jgi:hypothetical protein